MTILVNNDMMLNQDEKRQSPKIIEMMHLTIKTTQKTLFSSSPLVNMRKAGFKESDMWQGIKTVEDIREEDLREVDEVYVMLQTLKIESGEKNLLMSSDIAKERGVVQGLVDEFNRRSDDWLEAQKTGDMEICIRPKTGRKLYVAEAAKSYVGGLVPCIMYALVFSESRKKGEIYVFGGDSFDGLGWISLRLKQ